MAASAKPTGPAVPVQQQSNQKSGGVSGAAMKSQGRNVARANYQRGKK